MFTELKIDCNISFQVSSLNEIHQGVLLLECVICCDHGIPELLKNLMITQLEVFI